MKLAMVQPELMFGGVERMMLEIATRFDPVIYTCRHEQSETMGAWKEFDVRVLKPSPLEAPVSLFGRLDPDERMARLGRAGIRFLATKIKDDYDVINAHLSPAEWIRNRNGRVAWYCHCPSRATYQWKRHFLSQRNAFGKATLLAAAAAFDAVEQPIVGKVERICTNSKHIAGIISEYLGRQDAQVIYPGVDEKKFACNGYEKFFFYPSRIVPEKRFEIAMEAFRLAGLKGWRLVLGGLANTPQSRQYVAHLRRLAGAGSVEFEIDMDDAKLFDLYSRCSAVLFTPRLEDWGLVPIEAMASSKPVIAMNEGGPRESIVDGETGYLVDGAAEMAEKMRYLAGHPDVCEKMGKAGRRRVEQNYTWKIFLDRMEKEFKATAKM